ncbi:MAG: pyridoxal phosphate-dependent decarboxylase family protein [Paracoccaceae bacterium]
MTVLTLDPENWDELRQNAHSILDAALEKMQSAKAGRVWTEFPEAMKAELKGPVPQQGSTPEDVADKLRALLPYGVGNTHPRFFGWVHGAGNPGGVMADIAAAALNANLGGRDHGAIYVERQVIDWSRQMMGFPQGSSGLITSGTSMGTIVALKVARDLAIGGKVRATGLDGAKLVGYASEQSHACISRAFDMLGLGSDALRKIPCDQDFRMNINDLTEQIAADRVLGLAPFAVVGTAGSVNVGAIDDLSAIADVAKWEDLWFHVDGAFGATGMLSDHVRPMLNGLDRAHSLAFDFHKWLHVNYSAGCVLIRDRNAHLQAFSDRPEYLAGASRGLAANAPWPVDFGPELSRGFSALKIWAHLLEHGTKKLGASITRNCEQATFLGGKVESHPQLELLAPVALNIVCFRFGRSDDLNAEIVVQLQEQGLAVPSTTTINGKLAIRVNITNHRTQDSDLQFLIDHVVKIGESL